MFHVLNYISQCKKYYYIFKKIRKNSRPVVTKMNIHQESGNNIQVVKEDYLPHEIKYPLLNSQKLIANHSQKLDFSPWNKDNGAILSKKLEYFQNSKDIINQIMK